MRKMITAVLVMSFFAVEAALFYAGHIGLNLADATAPVREEMKAKASMWLASYPPETYLDVPKTIAKPVEDAWQKFASRGSTPRDGAASSNAAKPSEPATADVTALAPLGPSAPTDDPRIDISRISPDGTSVFAGTSRPHETVTLFADGKPVAEATTDDTGSWSIATSYRFASLDPKLSLERGAHGASDAPSTANSGAPQHAERHDEQQKLAQNEAADALKNFEAIVDAARRENAEQRESAKPSEEKGGDPAIASASSKDASKDIAVSTQPEAQKTPGEQKIARPDDPSRQTITPAPSDKTPREVKIPVPITFVYNRAELTADGTYAAHLLLDFVKLKGLGSVSLTGHADERGSNAYNYDLSRDRLDTIAKLLREGGYDGRLKLIPKGKSEPYRGVDRKALSREALYQIDRRVELKYVR